MNQYPSEMPCYGAEWNPEKAHQIRKEMFQNALTQKNWERVYGLIAFNPDYMALWLEMAYPLLPAEYKFRIPVKCYTHNGDSMPTVRKYVRQARKWMPLEKRLPAELASLPEITVYRASAESITEAANYISWTFTNDRQEKEIMQYRNIKNIEELDPAPIPCKTHQGQSSED